jgi:hypothetical protein
VTLDVDVETQHYAAFGAACEELGRIHRLDRRAWDRRHELDLRARTGAEHQQQNLHR